MRSTIGRIFCQRCRAANSVADEACAQCGTQLMLVVEPSGLRFEEAALIGGLFDEHLLERVTLLENNLSRVMDKLEKTLDLMLKQAQTSHTSHALLDALISTLAETGALNRRLLQTKWLARESPEAAGETAAADGAAADGTDKRLDAGTADAAEGLLARIVGRYEGERPEAFGRAVAEGLALLAAGKRVAAAGALGRAAATDQGNTPLDVLLGQILFVAGRPARAVDCRARAARAEPGDPSLAALLGLALGDTGDGVRAGELLRGAVECGLSTFAVHFALGRLAESRGEWRTAASEFKRAVERRECAAALYGLGHAQARLGRLRAAERSLRRAAEVGDEYPGVRELLESLRARRGAVVTPKRPRPAGSAAGRGADPRGGRAAGRPGGKTRGLQSGMRRSARRLVTGGEPRLLRLFAEELLGSAFPR